MIRLGKFDKEGYKQNFSKGELARELVCMNNDYYKLEQENKKYKEVINKIKNICDKVPYDWSVCGIDVVHKIEKILTEVEHD